MFQVKINPHDNPVQTLLNPWQFLPKGNSPRDWVRVGDGSTYRLQAPDSALTEFALKFQDQKGQDVEVCYDMPGCLGSISVRRGRLLTTIYMGDGSDFEFAPSKTFVETRVLDARGSEYNLPPEGLFAIEEYRDGKDGDYALSSILTRCGRTISPERWQEISIKRGDFAAVARLQSSGAISLSAEDRNKLRELLPDSVNYFNIYKEVKKNLSDAFMHQACPDFFKSIKKSQDDFNRLTHAQTVSR